MCTVTILVVEIEKRSEHNLQELQDGLTLNVTVNKTRHRLCSVLPIYLNRL